MSLCASMWAAGSTPETIANKLLNALPDLFRVCGQKGAIKRLPVKSIYCGSDERSGLFTPSFSPILYCFSIICLGQFRVRRRCSYWGGG